MGSHMAEKVSPLVMWGGGAVLVAVAVVAISSGNSSNPPKGTCELGAAGVALIVTGLTHGEESRAIASALSGVGASVACNAAVDSFKQDPAKPVSVSIDGTPQNIDANQLQQKLGEAQRSHSLACLATYGFGSQKDIDCLNYRIAP
jgi:hypothetical protein